MGTRFDQVDLRPAAFVEAEQKPALHRVAADVDVEPLARAGRWRRLLTFLADLSLFVALALAMSPLLELHGDVASTIEDETPQLLAFAAYLLLLSFYYFVVCWSVWGKTIGAAIFDVRICGEAGGPIDFRRASKRWAAMLLSFATGGLGFLLVILPGARSLADRLSGSRAYHSV